MKSDLYFVSAKGQNVFVSDNPVEAIKKYSELHMAHKYPFIMRFRKIPQYMEFGKDKPENPCGFISETSIIEMLTGMVTGAGISSLETEPKIEPSKPTPPSKPPIPVSKEPVEIRRGASIFLKKIGIEKGTLVGRVNEHSVYREMNLEILKAFRDLKIPVKRELIIKEIYHDRARIEKCGGSLESFIGAHLRFLVQKGVIVRLKGARYHLAPKTDAPAPKGDPEAERKAHEAVMAGAH